MAKKIEIAQLNFDTKLLLQTTANVKSELVALRQEQRELKKAGQEGSVQFVKNAAEIKNLSKEYNTLEKAVASNTDTAGRLVSTEEALNNALRSENVTVQNAIDNNKELRQIRNNLNATTEEGRKQIDLINAKIDQNTDFVKENGSAIEKLKMNIGNYKEDIVSAAKDLNIFNGGLLGFIQRANQSGGAGKLLKSTFATLVSGIKAATKAGIAFIATPIGAAIAALSAAFAAGKAIFDYNKGLEEANKELRALGVNTKDLSGVRSEIKATAETFDKEFTDIAKKVSSLANTYKISWSEANEIVARGLADGGAQNNEFLDSLGEYDQVFENAGYSAQNFIDIINQGYELGIYADKLPDAIKEADLALKEQTQATRDALINAFGATFTNELLKQVRTGEITTKNALEAISKKSTEVQLTQQQQAQLTADVFKSAGEDAGGALKVLEAIGDSANRQLDETAKKQIELQKATERLNKAQAELFEIEKFGDIWTTIKIAGIEALSAWLEYINQMKEDFEPIIYLIEVVFHNAWQTLKTQVSVVFGLIVGQFRVIGNAVKTFVNFFKKIIQGDFSGALDALKEGFVGLLNIVDEVFGKIKNTIIDGIKSILENIKPVVEFFGGDVEAINKSLDSLKSKSIEVSAELKKTELEAKTVAENNIVADFDPDAEAKTQKAIDDRIKKQKEEIDLFIAQQGFRKKGLQEELDFEEKLMQKRLALLEIERVSGRISLTKYQAEYLEIKNDYAEKQAKVSLELLQQEVEDYEIRNKSVIEVDKRLTDELINVEFNRLDTLNAMRMDALKSQLDNELITQREYNNSKLLLEQELQEQKNELQNQYNSQQREDDNLSRQLDFDNKMLQLEEQYATELEVKNERALQDRETALATLEQQRTDDKISEENYQKALKNIEAQYANEKLEIERMALDAKLQGHIQVAQGIAQIVGKESAVAKIAAIAAATIDTYRAANLALATLPPPFGGIQAGISITTGLANVLKIGRVKGAEGVAAGLGSVASGVGNFSKGKIPKAEKGALFNIGGQRHSAGGTLFTGADGTQFEAEQGELIGVMNRNAARHFMAFNNAFPSGS